ncbi:MAG TPA: acyltransferase [Pyrinomonadaceae bacterium]|nr:acyltransferase [Pyrinomonadaceae bacterium]
MSRHVPELDGLRGIAIIVVLIHHQMTPLSLGGGFLGVDLFFVLSGYLITSLLWAEFERTGSISLKNFYVRRLLRLGPALALYLVASLAVTYHTQLISLGRQLKLIIIAILYSTNWRMALGWDSVLDPTAIIWSLSIEEQFYLVWPLLAFACFALGLKRGYMIGALAVTILSVALHRYFLYGAGVDLTRLYYGTDTRADALLVGCVIAFVPVAIVGPRTKRSLGFAGMFAAVGLAYSMIALSFSNSLLYRGGFTVVAVLAGILIFVAANSPPRILSLVLKWTPLRWFGHISYGLYLWHWLIVRNTSLYFLGRWEGSARLVIALGIASLSFYVVERPFNRLKSRYAAAAKSSPAEALPAEPKESLAPRSIPLANYQSSTP